MIFTIDYYDTNLLISSARPEEGKKHVISKNMVRDVEIGKKILILPRWALLELIDAIKRLIARKSKSSKYTPSQIEKIIKDTINKLISFVTRMVRKGNIIMPENNEVMHGYYEWIYRKLKKYPIRVVKDGRHFKMRSMGFRDMEHLYHAQKSGKVRFCTWDRGFEDAMTDEDFDMVKITVLELPRDQDTAA